MFTILHIYIYIHIDDTYHIHPYSIHFMVFHVEFPRSIPHCCRKSTIFRLGPATGFGGRATAQEETLEEQPAMEILWLYDFTDIDMGLLWGLSHQPYGDIIDIIHLSI